MKVGRLYGPVLSTLVIFYCFEYTEGSKFSEKHDETSTSRGKSEGFPRRRLSSADDAFSATIRERSYVKEYHRVFADSIRGCIRKMTNGVRTMARFSKRQYKRTIDSIILWTIGLLQSMQDRLKETIYDNLPAEPAPTISYTHDVVSTVISGSKNPSSQSKKDEPVKRQAIIDKPIAASGTPERKQASETLSPTDNNVQNRTTTTFPSGKNLPKATSKTSLHNKNEKKSVMEDLATVRTISSAYDYIPTVMSSSKSPSSQSTMGIARPKAVSDTTEKKQASKTSSPIDNDVQNTLHSGKNLPMATSKASLHTDNKKESIMEDSRSKNDMYVQQQANIVEPIAVSDTTEKKQASKTSSYIDNNGQNTLHSGKNLLMATSKALLHNNNKKESIMGDSRSKNDIYVQQQATIVKPTAISDTTEKKQASKTSSPIDNNGQNTLHSGKNLLMATSKAPLHDNNEKESIMEDSRSKKDAPIKQKATAVSSTTEKNQISKTSTLTTPSDNIVQDKKANTLHSGKNLPKATSKSSLHPNSNKKRSIMEDVAKERSGGKSAFDSNSAAILDEDEITVPATSYLGYLFPTLVSGLVFAVAGSSLGYLWNGDWTEVASTVTGYFWGDDIEKSNDITMGGEDAYVSSAIPVTPDKY